MATGLRLSVAIPIPNEESVLPELLLRLRSMLDAIAGGEHEIVFVDDGSTDQTQIMASGIEGGRALRSADESAVDSRANLTAPSAARGTRTTSTVASENRIIPTRKQSVPRRPSPDRAVAAKRSTSEKLRGKRG
jgi:hypothetical protein